jgi:hypothetical protein
MRLCQKSRWNGASGQNMTLKGKEDDYGYDENVVTVMEAVNMA